MYHIDSYILRIKEGNEMIQFWTLKCYNFVDDTSLASLVASPPFSDLKLGNLEGIKFYSHQPFLAYKGMNSFFEKVGQGQQFLTQKKVTMKTIELVNKSIPAETIMQVGNVC